jgi:hypothetical protein
MNDIASIIKRDNPQISDEKLELIVRRAYTNEKEHPRKKSKAKRMAPDETTEPGKTSATDAKLAEENAKLREKLAKLEAERGADSDKTKLAKELEDARKLAAELAKERESLIKAQVDSMLSLLEEHGFKRKDFDNKSRDYIQGAYDVAKDMSDGPDDGEAVDADEADTDADTDESNDRIHTADYHYDADSGRMYRLVKGEKVFAGETDVFQTTRAKTGKNKKAPART